MNRAQLPFSDWDFKHPDLTKAFRHRLATLNRIRQNPAHLAYLKAYYRDNPIQFMIDWGSTFDPRNIGDKLPAVLPFYLFPKQIDWCEFILDCWRNKDPGITEKSRDMGASWLAIGLSCTLCLFNNDMVIGFGSRKEEYVDKLDSPKALFSKARLFMRLLPPEFRNGWDAKTDAPYMRIKFPGTNSVITGEAGDNIGRGDRTALYFVDEGAHIERPEMVDASLSATTNCRQDMSSVNGMNAFGVKRFSGKIRVFTLHWRDDPRKDEAWYAKQCAVLSDVVVAQEIDINYSASAEGILIPQTWVQAAIDAHVKLGITVTGGKRGGLDVADEGVDKNAFAGRHGILLEHVKEWSGKGGDIMKTVVQAFSICDELLYDVFDYDADGLGAGVRGDSRSINEARRAEGIRELTVHPFRGSGAVHDPEGEMVPKRLNKDMFQNAKAQSWWSLRLRFQETYRAVVEGGEYDPDKIISLSSTLPDLTALCMELSQPTYRVNDVGRFIVNKAPEGTKSPNLADAVMIAYQPAARAIDVWQRLTGD